MLSAEYSNDVHRPIPNGGALSYRFVISFEIFGFKTMDPLFIYVKYLTCMYVLNHHIKCIHDI